MTPTPDDDPILRELVDHRLVEPIAGGGWRLTERGRDWYVCMYVLIQSEIDAELA
jgi:hypothetical protein